MAIVYSGTKINIDYFLNDIMKENRIEEIFDYFNSAETNRTNKSTEELDKDNYTENEIRMILIKSLSENRVLMDKDRFH